MAETTTQAPQQVEFEGRAYRLAPMTVPLRAQFETWLERRALEAVKRKKHLFTDEEYGEALAGVFRDIAVGQYAFGGEECVRAARSVPGVKELLRLSLAKNYPEVDAEFIDRLFEQKTAEVAAAFQITNAEQPADGGGAWAT